MTSEYFAPQALKGFKYLSKLASMKDGCLLFLITVSSDSSLGYDSDLYMFDGRKLACLTQSGRVTGFAIEEPFIYLTEEADKENLTTISRFRPGDADREVLYSTDRVLGLIEASSGHLIVEIASAPLSVTECADADVSILQELPFWRNGIGYVNQYRKGLHILSLDTKVLRPISSDLFHVKGYSFSSEQNQLG